MRRTRDRFGEYDGRFDDGQPLTYCGREHHCSWAVDTVPGPVGPLPDDMRRGHAGRAHVSAEKPDWTLSGRLVGKRCSHTREYLRRQEQLMWPRDDRSLIRLDGRQARVDVILRRHDPVAVADRDL